MYGIVTKNIHVRVLLEETKKERTEKQETKTFFIVRKIVFQVQIKFAVCSLDAVSW